MPTMTATTRSPRPPACGRARSRILRAYGRYLQQAGIPQSQGFIAAALNRYPDIARGAVHAVRRALRSGCSRREAEVDGQAPQGQDQGCAGGGAEHRRRHHHPPLPQPDRSLAAHQPFRCRHLCRAAARWRSSSIRRRSTACRSRGRGARSSSTAPRSRACICASARWRAAACAGRTAPQDYRTEVLGLVKAQQVKNAVIVPVGAKGGFFPKRLPAGGSRDAIFEAGTQGLCQLRLQPAVDHRQSRRRRGRAAARTWSGATATIPISSSPPTRARRPSPTPPTRISQKHGFWLDDAFASGGSAGYDHKKMGITARGAWEAVKRHFREMNRDIQTDAVHRRRRRRHVGRRVRQRHAAVASRPG